MEQKRSPRFRRIIPAKPIHLTLRDHEILKLVFRYHFIRSDQLISLIAGSKQNILRRLHLLFHHGYLERPRAQIQYYERTGSESIAYGLGSNGAIILKKHSGVLATSNLWNEKIHCIGRLYLEHTLLVTEIMVSIEKACRLHKVGLLHQDQLSLPAKQTIFKWRVKLHDGTKYGVIPDRTFALEYADTVGQLQRVYFFLEADRGTMPVIRKNLNQTSFQRKLIAYEATWAHKVHLRHLKMSRFRVLTVTTNEARLSSILAACRNLSRGHGLFLFADRSALKNNLLSAVWKSGKTGEWCPPIELAQTPILPPSS